jgi:hypothetical protein
MDEKKSGFSSALIFVGPQTLITFKDKRGRMWFQLQRLWFKTSESDRKVMDGYLD